MSGSTDVDIIVVGGGSAGCAVAGRLAEHSALKVMLIEAGKAKPDINTRIPAMVAKLVMNPAYDWVLPVEADASVGGQPGFWPAGKCLGGGSSINGMMYIRGHADDYDAWARLGAKGWGYADCLPYFLRMESNPRGGPFHGSSGPLKVSESRLDYPLTDAWIDSAVAAGVPRCADLNGDGYQAIGVDRVQASQHNGNRWSSADAYVRSDISGGRLQVIDEARVMRIIVENGVACGIELSRPDGTRQTIRSARGVVLSTGALASPKVLMLSGIGPAGQLAALGIDPLRDLPGVGQNLQDHVGLNVAWDVRGRSINSDLRGFGPMRGGIDYLMWRRGMLTAAISNAQALVRTREGLSSPNIQIAFSPFAFEILPGGVRHMPKQSMVSMLVCVMHPGSRGSIALRSANPDDPALIRHELLGDPDDLAQICEGVALARGIMAQQPIAEAVVAEAKPGIGIEGDALREWVRERAISCFHQVGTCRMGTDDMAVVTPELKVRGLEGLWVADCSVMPRQVGANTNATAIMIGDKAASHVLADLGLVAAMAA